MRDGSALVEGVVVGLPDVTPGDVRLLAWPAVPRRRDDRHTAAVAEFLGGLGGTLPTRAQVPPARVNPVYQGWVAEVHGDVPVLREVRGLPRRPRLPPLASWLPPRRPPTCEAVVGRAGRQAMVGAVPCDSRSGVSDGAR